MFVFKNFARLLVLILLTAAQFSLYAQKDVTADVKSFKKEAEAEKKKVAEMELKKRNKAKSEEAIKAKAKKDKIKKLQDDLKKINAEIKKQNLDIKSANKNIAKINVDMINQNKKEELDKLSEKKDREAKKIITCNERIKDLRIDAKRINTELESVKDVYEIAEGTLNWSKDYNISNKSKYVNGKWSVHVKARDDRDNYSPEVGVNIIIDPKSDIPLVNVINPLPNAKVLGNLKIVGTAYDDDAVDRVEIIVDNEKEKRAAEGTDFWSYDLDTSMMKDGEHFFRVKVYDINGILSKEVQVPFQLNRRTPFIEINTIKSGSVVSGKMNVGGIASDDNGIVSVEYSVDDRETFTRIGMIKNLAKNRVKVQWSIGIDSGLLADGTQTVWIRAADKAGSVDYSPLTVIVDHKKPEIWFDFPRDRDKVDGKFTAFGYAYDNVDVKGVEITITGAGMDGKPMPVTLLPGNPLWSYPVDLSKGKSGFYKLTAAVTDVSGNKTVSSVTVSLDEDLDKPKLILKSIANDDRISNSLPLFGDVSDDDGMKEVIVTITKDQAKTPVFQKNIAAKYSFSFDVDASDTSKFTDGKYKVELVPVDINNTKGDLVSVDFWIDRSYPEFDNEFINKNIAGKYFKKVIEVANIQVKKSGALKSVKYSISDLANDQILVKSKELKFTPSKKNGYYDVEAIKEDFTKDAKFADKLVAINLTATDFVNRSSNLSIPVIVDMKEPEIKSPVIDSKKGMMKDESIVVSDNVLLKTVKIDISSSDKTFKPITGASLAVGEDKEYVLKVKTADGGMAEYSFTITATDVSGFETKLSNFKVSFKETKSASLKLTVSVKKKDTLITYSNPKLLIARETVGYDEINRSIYGLIPEGYSNLNLSGGSLNVSGTLLNSDFGIYNFDIGGDANRASLAPGINNISINGTRDGGSSSLASLNIVNDNSDPKGLTIWPPSYMSFNENISIFGVASDDTGEVKVQYSVNSEDAYNDVSLESISNLKNYKVPELDPLKRTQSIRLSDYVADNNLPIDQLNDKLFKIDLPMLDLNMKEGEHTVRIKITDNAGKTTIKKVVTIFDKTPPSLRVWSQAPKKVEVNDFKNNILKNIKNAKDKEFFEKFYKINSSNTFYILEERLTDDQRFRILDILGKTGYNCVETANGQITLRGDSSDNNSLTNVVVMHNGVENIAKGRYLWEALYDLNELEGVNFDSVESIPHTIDIFAIDKAGNKKFASKDVLIDTSTDIPEIFINSPAVDGQRFTDFVEIGGIALDDDGIDYVQFRIDFGDPGSVLDTVKKEEVKWERIDMTKGNPNWFKKIPKDSISPGKHVLEAQAVDMYGALSKIKSVTFHIDNENPVIRILSPINGEYLRGETVINGRASDPNDIDIVEISTNYGWTFSRAEGTTSWKYYFDFRSVPDGPLRTLIKVRDQAGSESLTFALYNIDNTPPEIDILMPKDGMTLNNKYRIVGRAKDNIKIDSVKLYVDGNVGSKNVIYGTEIEGEDEGYFETEGDNKAWYFDLDTRYLTPKDKYQLIARVRDLAGNVSEKSLNFTVDPASDLPKLVLDQPQPGQHLTGQTIDFFGTAWDDDGIDKVLVKIDDGDFVEARGSELWNFSLSTVGLTPGEHKIFVVAYEKTTAENEKQKTISLSRQFYFDEFGPVIEVKSHINGAPMEHRPWLMGKSYFYDANVDMKLKKQIQYAKFKALKKKFRRDEEKVKKLEETIDQIEVKPYEVAALKNKYMEKNKVESIYLSLDNGKTFTKHIGFPSDWQIRVQTQYLIDGQHVLQIKSVTKSGLESLRYFRVAINRKAPEVIIDSPVDSDRINDKIMVRGSANDDGEVDEVKIMLRRFDKNLGKVPQFVQGIYLWAQIFGGPYVSGGFGLSFFDDVVRVEGMFSWIPTKENMEDMGISQYDQSRFNPQTGWPNYRYEPRFYGFCTGGKLLAKIIDIPFEFFFGEDAKNFSISVEIGCGFYWFSGYGGGSTEKYNLVTDKNSIEYKDSAYKKGKVIAGFMYQIDLFKVERWSFLRKFAIYFENIFYFIASEVEGGLTPQIGFGIRNAFF
jgi:hypothetical protein